jgi:hypothetical protein
MEKVSQWYDEVSKIWSTVEPDYLRADPFPAEYSNLYNSVQEMMANCSQPRWIFWGLAYFKTDEQIQAIETSISYLTEIWLKQLSLNDLKPTPGITKLIEFITSPVLQITDDQISSLEATILAIRTKGGGLLQKKFFWDALNDLVEAKKYFFLIQKNQQLEQILQALNRLAGATWETSRFLNTSKFEEPWAENLKNKILTCINK